jgi:hypothetical protein
VSIEGVSVRRVLGAQPKPLSIDRRFLLAGTIRSICTSARSTAAMFARPAACTLRPRSDYLLHIQWRNLHGGRRDGADVLLGLRGK